MTSKRAAQRSLRRSIGAVLFDFDGTLVPSLSLWTASFQAAIQSEGNEIHFEEAIEYCLARKFQDTLDRFPIACIDTFSSRIWRSIAEPLLEIPPYPGVVEALGLLSEAGFEIGIPTANRRSVVTPYLDRHGITERFGSVVGSEDVTNQKPHREPLDRVLRELSIAAEDAWIVGDSIADILAGKNAGVRTIAYAPEENARYWPVERLTSAKPDFIAKDFPSLVEIILTKS